MRALWQPSSVTRPSENAFPSLDARASTESGSAHSVLSISLAPVGTGATSASIASSSWSQSSSAVSKSR